MPTKFTSTPTAAMPQKKGHASAPSGRRRMRPRAAPTRPAAKASAAIVPTWDTASTGLNPLHHGPESGGPVALRSSSPKIWMSGMWPPPGPTRTSSVPRSITSVTKGTRVTADRATPHTIPTAGRMTRRTASQRPDPPRTASQAAHAAVA